MQLDKLFIFFFLSLCLSHSLSAQSETTVEIKKANSFESSDSADLSIKKLIGDVHLIQEDITLFCDTAFFILEENKVDAFGNVRILQGDSIEIFCDKLKYNGKTKVAYLTKNARVINGATTIESDFIKYNVDQKSGYYKNYGSITQNGTTIKSKKAFYYEDEKRVVYEEDVELKNEDLFLKGAYLEQDLENDKITFYGKTEIVSEGRKINTNRGYFDSKNNIISFSEKTTIRNKGELIRADSIYIDEKNEIQNAYGNAEITNETLSLKGNIILNDGKTGLIKIYENGYIENEIYTLKGNSIVFNQMSKKGELFGNAFVQNEGNQFYGDSIFFDDGNQTGKIIGNAKVVNDTSEVIGDFISFDKNKDSAEIIGNAEIKTEKNHFTGREIYFQNGKGKIIGNAKAIKDGSTIVGDEINFDDKNKRLEVYKDAFIIDKQNKINGDTIIYINDLGIAKGNVVFIDTVENIRIDCGKAEFEESKNYVVASNKPIMKKMIDGDSLFLKADTLITYTDSASQNFTAFKNVVFFKSDMQGIADSIFYNQEKETFEFFKKPILWVEESQLKADSIVLFLKDNVLHKVKLNENSTIGSITYKNIYDQVYGQEIIGYFKDNEFDKMQINKSAESIYFLKNEQLQFTGLNKSKSDSMTVFFKNEQVSKINYIKQIESKYYPIRSTNPYEERVTDFKWFTDKRPNMDYFGKPLN